MIGRTTCRFLFLIATPSILLGQHHEAKPLRDAQSLEILTRVMQAAGGAQAIRSVRDISESGEITVYFSDTVKGPVTIRTLGENHFRMEADLPDDKIIWIVKDGVGSKKERDKVAFISRENAINLCNLTYPVGHVFGALFDSSTNVSFVGLEKREGRSVYRIRVKGRLGLVADSSPANVEKELIIDSLTFDILGVADRPYATYKRDGGPSDSPPREIEFGDFRSVKGVRLPFSIVTKLQGQRTLSIGLEDVTLNTDISVGEFQVQK